MSLPSNKTGFTFNHVDQVDNYGPTVGNFTTVQQNLDSRSEEMRIFVNSVLNSIRSTTDGDSGADNIGATAIGTSGTTVQEVLEYLKTQIDNVALGQIPDGSLTDIKLSDTAGQIKDRVSQNTALMADLTQDVSTLNITDTILTRDILRMKLRQTGLNLDPNAWSDSLEDASGINTLLSNGFEFNSGKLIFSPNTKSLLHFNGADGSTTFTDESGKTWTVFGNAQIDTAQSKFGGASGLFDGTGDYILTDDSEDFNVGSGDFTVDFWVKRNTIGTQQYLFGQAASSPTNETQSFLCRFNSDDTILAQVRGSDGSYTAYPITSSTTITDTTNFHHIALERFGNTMTLYIDGISVGAVDVTGVTVNNSTNKFAIASLGEQGTVTLNGWMDEFRFSKGIARYQGNFTPPTSEYSLESQGVITWDSTTSEGTLLTAIVEAVENLNTGTITYEISRDGGITKTTVPLDTPTDISAQPSGTSIVLTVTITGDAELLAVAWGGEI